ncbi:MAG: hypothetical protein R3E83_02065 [Burkholderiaceae bacterium]
MRTAIIIVTLGLLIRAPAHAQVQGDPQAGKRAYAQCALCHALEFTPGKGGPHLQRVVGRRLAGDPGFARYSAAIVALGEQGLRWTPALLTAFLTCRWDDRLAGVRHQPPTPHQQSLDVIAYLRLSTDAMPAQTEHRR